MNHGQNSEPGLLGKLFALVAGALLLIVGFLFSVFLFAVIIAVGLLVWGYVWWKTREVRRAMREQSTGGGTVIEGEAIVVERSDDGDGQDGSSRPNS